MTTARGTLVLMMVLGTATVAQAAAGRGNGGAGNNGNGSNSGNLTQSQLQQLQQQQLQQQQQQLQQQQQQQQQQQRQQQTPATPTTNPARATDQAAVKKAERDLAALRGKKQAEFMSSPDFTAALAAQKQARADYAAAVAPLKDKVHSTPEYQAAAAQKAKAAAHVRDAQKDSAAGADPQDLAESARSIMAAGQTMRRLEATAVSSDPKAADAQTTLAAANAKVATLHAGFDQSLKSDQDYVAAQKALDDARQKLAPAGH